MTCPDQLSMDRLAYLSTSFSRRETVACTELSENDPQCSLQALKQRFRSCRGRQKGTINSTSATSPAPTMSVKQVLVISCILLQIQTSHTNEVRQLLKMFRKTRCLLFLAIFLIISSSVNTNAPNPPGAGLVHKRFEYKYSFKPPYLAQKDGTVPFWEYGGSKYKLHVTVFGNLKFEIAIIADSK